MWSNLSIDEQQKYKTNIFNGNKNIQISSHENNLTKKTMNELKEICQKYDLKKNGNKKQLIDRIQEFKNKKNDNTPQLLSHPIHEKPYIIYDDDKEEKIQNQKNIDDDDNDSSNISTSSSPTSFLDDDQYDFDLLDD